MLSSVIQCWQYNFDKTQIALWPKIETKVDRKSNKTFTNTTFILNETANLLITHTTQ